jgi:hypothetical protein
MSTCGDCETCTLMLWFARSDRQKAITRGIETAEAWTPGCSAQHRPSAPHHVCRNCIHVGARCEHSYRPQQIGHTNHPPKLNAAPFTRHHTHNRNKLPQQSYLHSLNRIYSMHRQRGPKKRPNTAILPIMQCTSQCMRAKPTSIS